MAKVLSFLIQMRPKLAAAVLRLVFKFLLFALLSLTQLATADNLFSKLDSCAQHLDVFWPKDYAGKRGQIKHYRETCPGNLTVDAKRRPLLVLPTTKMENGINFLYVKVLRSNDSGILKSTQYKIDVSSQRRPTDILLKFKEMSFTCSGEETIDFNLILNFDVTNDPITFELRSKQRDSESAQVVEKLNNDLSPDLINEFISQITFAINGLAVNFANIQNGRTVYTKKLNRDNANNLIKACSEITRTDSSLLTPSAISELTAATEKLAKAASTGTTTPSSTSGGAAN